MRSSALLGLAVLAASASAGIQRSFTIRVAGPATSSTTEHCFLRIRGRVVGGGAEVYCLEHATGAPGPNAVVRDSGAMTFQVRDGTIRTLVRIVQRFGADGRHARQSLTGRVGGGTGRFRGARGSIRGGGTDVEALPA